MSVQKKFIYCDFEFSAISERKLELVAACFYVENQDRAQSYWLHKNPEKQKELKNQIEKWGREGYVFLAYQVVAEGRAFETLGLNPMDFQWIDLMIEYKHISNHNDNIMYGWQLHLGKPKWTKRPPPKWERTEKDDKQNFKQSFSLAEATYKLTGEIRDTKHKDTIRDLIISNPAKYSSKSKKDILTYVEEDVVHLPQIYKKIVLELKRLLGSDFKLEQIYKEMLFRGRYSALTSIRESKGYPIDYEKARAFSTHVESILEEVQREINRLFPDIKPFRYDFKDQKFHERQKEIKQWVKDNCDVNRWKKTDTKDVSLSLEAFEREFPYKHSYPKDNFGAQMVRYKKLKQSLNGFLPSSSKKSKSFWDFVGSDGWVRPYMNIYGSQTSRTQPSATGFLMLKPAWMRALAYPPKGYAYTSIDYKSEEFFISALESNDKKMIESYLSGDVYMDFAIKAGNAPKGATKKTHGPIRDSSKSTVLGMSYDMTKIGLAKKLTLDTGREWTEDQAQEQIDLFQDTYSTFYNFKVDNLEEYEDEGYLKLKDGWYLWGDNDNFRSVGNFKIQGQGACIMRMADLLCYEEGLYVPFTLHDALYILHPSDDLSAIDTACECLVEGFAYYYGGKKKELARKIMLDVETWGPDFKGVEKIVTPKGRTVHTEDIHVDERAKDEYEKFSKYFEPLDKEGIFN